MRRLFQVLLVSCLCAMSLWAGNPGVRYMRPSQINRSEIFIPQVNGYNVYKADLHIHSIYSDGHATPELRVREAWCDGLDIIAITEHLESRKREQEYLEFVKGYTGWKALKARNWWVYKTPPDKDGILADLNVSYKAAVKMADRYGMTLIPGIEITREPTEFGHFNVLFLEDANGIYAPDPLESLRKARRQNALIMHNHPGWSCTTNAKTTFQKKAYDEGLIDGVEVANGIEFYPDIIDRCLDEHLFIAANTDMHDVTSDAYTSFGLRRTMTLVLAEDKSIKSVREALEARRTMAFCAGEISGEENLLKALFNASVSAEMMSADREEGTCLWKITNISSLTYRLSIEGAVLPIEVPEMSSVCVALPYSGNIQATVVNMWCGEDRHPCVDL